MSNQISTYLKYAHLQIAAEAFIAPKNSTPANIDFASLAGSVLTEGNTRSSRFTPTDAEWFEKDWEVVEHISNTPTGFWLMLTPNRTSSNS